MGFFFHFVYPLDPDPKKEPNADVDPDPFNYVPYRYRKQIRNLGYTYGIFYIYEPLDFL